MDPTLKVGSIHIGIKNTSEPQIGNIYCYRYRSSLFSYNSIADNLFSSSEFLILHRLIDIDSDDINGNFYIFKGDNNLSNDKFVSKLDILYIIY